MKYILHLEHARFFQNQGFILFEQLVSPQECSLLEESILAFIHSLSRQTETSRWKTNLFRSLPIIQTIIKKRKLDHFAAELIHRPRLALTGDVLVQAFDPVPTGHEDCHLLLCLSGKQQGQGAFFTESLPEQTISLESNNLALFLAFSAKGLPIS